ncbi:MAG TPA: autotransporter [Burkholderiales bacterium]|nr:autotransporter [Burkholderiales bacterium]
MTRILPAIFVSTVISWLACTGVTHDARAATPAASAPSSTRSIGRETPWPRVIKSGTSTLSVYQPQLDTWDGYKLSARVAVQVASGDNPPHTRYGVMTLAGQTLTDKGQRVVTIEKAQVVKSEFPSATPAEAKTWSAAVAKDLAGKSRTIALDRLEAQLATADSVEKNEQQDLANTPPKILFSQAPAILVFIDGDPAWRALSGTSFERAINTRPLLLRDKQGVCYLKVFDGWMSAPSLQAQWTVVAKPSQEMQAIFKKATDARSVDPLTGQTTPDKPAPSLKQTAPLVYIATTPTELIVTEGAPQYVPIEGTQLLYVKNSTGRVFKEIADNTTYVLVTGRWFHAPGEDGPWEFVAADQLPLDFVRIPDDSPMENVKASVAGTPQAREAAIAATVPQTAAVKIAGTKLTPPVFDGDPVFKTIDGTPLQYAANTPTPIVRVDDKSYYAVENAVWFVATGIRGPWTVATSVPAVIYSIPASSPLHYVTCVRIYSVSNGIVYEGYTSGYQGTYVDPLTGVVVYGTGYAYDPWLGTVWYGPPVTYGFGASVAYTPWTGWAVAFGFGWAWGASTVAVGWGWGPYPWWGPWGWGWAWGPPVYPWYPAWGVARGPGGGAVAFGPGGWAGYSGNIYRNWGDRASVSRVAGGYNAWTGNAWATQVSASYNSRTGVSAAGQRGAVQNVYTGNYATGARGAAVGPQGNAVVGERGSIGNAATGQQASGSRGAYYNKETGQWTSFGGATGKDGGHVAHVGDDVYAGKDGNVYRRTDSGWEQHGSGGWQPVAGSAQGEATRDSTGGLGAQRAQPPERDFGARQDGAARVQNLHQSSAGMGAHFGGRMGGGFRRR